MDWLLTPVGTLDVPQELASAIKMALGSVGLADPDDVIPDLSDNRRGWWGDQDAEVIWNGWPVGSRLWLLTRAKIQDAGAREGGTVANVETYIKEALAPFISKRIASRIDVTATRTGVNEITANITIYRGPLAAIQLQYQVLWDELE